MACGHYVAFVKHEEHGWLEYDDKKVRLFVLFCFSFFLFQFVTLTYLTYMNMFFTVGKSCYVGYCAEAAGIRALLQEGAIA